MVGIIKDRPCPSCGQKHTVCMPTEDMFAAGKYAYDCPVTNEEVVFSAGRSDWDLVDLACPPKHVLAVRVSV
ncbi:MAG TPA: hypothetical protein VGJ05_08775 [Fimbriiglobus sp.]